MKKIIALLGVTGCLVLASGTALADNTLAPPVQAAPQSLSPAATSLIQSQITLQQQRAGELQTIVNRDNQALTDVSRDITTLTNHMSAMNQGASAFTAMAAAPATCAVTDPTLTQAQCAAAFAHWASEYTAWAAHDQELINHQTTIKNELAAAVKTEGDWLAWHKTFIAELQARLAGH